jgi:hypothetical protein
MRAPIAALIAALSLAGCCAGAYPVVTNPYAPPFDAFQASIKLAVGMPTDVAILLIGSEPISGQVTSCGILAGYEWTCQLLRFGWCENNQLLVYIAQTPDGRGVVNSWSVRKG